MDRGDHCEPTGLAEPDGGLLAEAVDRALTPDMRTRTDGDPFAPDDMRAAVGLILRGLVTLELTNASNLQQLGLDPTVGVDRLGELLREHARALAIENVVLASAHAYEVARARSEDAVAELKRVHSLASETSRADRGATPVTVLDHLGSILRIGDLTARLMSLEYKRNRSSWEVAILLRPVVVGLLVGALAYTTLTEVVQSAFPVLNSLLIALVLAATGWAAVSVLDRWTYRKTADRWRALMKIGLINTGQAFVLERTRLSILRRGVHAGDVDPAEIGGFNSTVNHISSGSGRLSIGGAWGDYKNRLVDSVQERSASESGEGSSIRP